MPKRRGKRWTASGYDKSLARKIHLGTFDTRGEAAEAEARHRIKSVSQPTGRETCDQFAERWTRDYPRPREATTLTNVERLKPFARDFSGVRLGAVDRPRARAWALKHRHQVPAVRAMFNDALRDGLIDCNPFAGLRLPASRGRKDIAALTEEQLVALADTALHPGMEMGAYGPQYRAMILFSGYVGLRPGELYGLRREDLDGQLCVISRSLSHKSHKIGPTKNGKPRTVMVPPGAQDALLDVPTHRSGLLFTTPRGEMWTQPSNHRYFKQLRALAGRPGLDWYELRHCAASMMVERGAAAWEVAVQLGHQDGGRLVQTLYGHPSEDLARQRLLALWDRQTGPTPIRSGAAREQAS